MLTILTFAGLLLPAGLAWAADPVGLDPARYPLRTQVELPAPVAGKVVRIPLPLNLRSAAEPVDGSDLALLDPEGVARGFALARGEGAAERLPLRLRPGEETLTWIAEGTERPVSALEVELGGRAWVARVGVDRQEGGAWVAVGEPVLVWEHDQGSNTSVPIPGLRGPFRVRIERLHETATGLVRVDAIIRAQPHVEPLTVELPVSAPILQEDGWARYTIDLGLPLPVRSVRLHPEEPVFERSVEVRRVSELDPGHWSNPNGSIRRVRLGGADLDMTTLLVEPGEGDLLVVWVESSALVPLRIPTATVELEGAELLLPEARPGTWTLLGGAPAQTSPSGDIGLALPELARLAVGSFAASEVQANPLWQPPELRAGLALPSTEISLRGMRWEHAVEGGPGLVRLPLGAEVVADAQAGLADLRLVDAQGQQIPYLLRQRPVDAELGALEFTRTEQGSRSVLRAALPLAGEHDDGPPISAVRITTSAPVFSRTITLSRARGATLDPIRVITWSGSERPSTLSVEVGQPLGRELVLTIENGDDPPLPIDGLSASVRSMELVASLPEGGARLVYGDRQRPLPDYDLSLLRGELFARATAVASLGPRRALEPTPPSGAERAMVLGGLAALIGGLIVLVIGLLRAVPPEAPAEVPAGPAPDQA